MENKYAKLFAQSMKAEQAKNQKSDFSLENYISFKPNNTYRFRLLFYPNQELGRTKAFINKYIHICKDKNGKTHYTVCNSSEYLDGTCKTCPICQSNQYFWEHSSRVNPASKSKVVDEYYSSFKRKERNYAVVYVVNDTQNPENNGKCKIMSYSWSISKFLNMYVYGIVKKDWNSKTAPQPIDEDMVLGYDAFNLKAGRDLIINTTPKKVGSMVYNDYSLAFASKPTSIPLDEDDLPKIFADLKFDDLYESIDNEKQKDFYNYMQLCKESLAYGDISSNKQEEIHEEVSSNVEQTARNLDVQIEDIPDLDATSKTSENVVPVEKPAPKSESKSDDDWDLSNWED